MINAEKLTIYGKDWIKVSFNHDPLYDATMSTVLGAIYNPGTKLWAVPYENRADFERKMADFLILWKGEESAITAGGIPEDRIPDQPIVPGYSVTYDEEGKIVGATGFKRKPWGEFQVRGFNVLYKTDFLILADDAGLGKTFQVATAMEAKKRMGQLKHGVVICKASLIYNWRDEIHMHTNERAIVVAGSRSQRMKIYSQLSTTDDWCFVIVSYETFRTDLNNFHLLHKLKGLDFAVADEAHKVKNPTSKLGDAIHYIPFRFKYVLTATPLPNSPIESYNYLRWGGKVQTDWFNFQNYYAIMGGRKNQEILGYKNIRELRRLIQVNMLRRLKKDKLKELPDVTFKTIALPMTAQQTTLYNAVKKDILEDLKDTSLTKVPSALAKLLRLQQITDSPALIGVEKPDSSKLEALDDLLESLIDEGREKVIIFSRFKTMVDILTERYARYNPAVIHGDVSANGIPIEVAMRRLRRRYSDFDGKPAEEKQQLIDLEMASDRQLQVYKFQRDADCRLFIGCAPACREGLTLTAATHVVFIDCEWSPAYVEQAFSRAHRIGQKNAVSVYYLVCEDTIDEFVQRVLHRKETMAQIMLDNGVPVVGQQRARDLIAELIGVRLEDVA